MALSATLALSSPQLDHPTRWKLRVELHNDGPDPIRVSTAAMLGAISFEVVDAGSRRVALGPPPTPPVELESSVSGVEPGASLRLDFHGDDLFAEPPLPGRYRLRFAGRAAAVADSWEGQIVSPWAEFSVSEPSA